MRIASCKTVSREDPSCVICAAIPLLPNSLADFRRHPHAERYLARQRGGTMSGERIYFPGSRRHPERGNRGRANRQLRENPLHAGRRPGIAGTQARRLHLRHGHQPRRSWHAQPSYREIRAVAHEFILRTTRIAGHRVRRGMYLCRTSNMRTAAVASPVSAWCAST